MFGISFWKNGEMISQIRLHIAHIFVDKLYDNIYRKCEVALSRDFVIFQHFRLCSLFNKHVLDCFSTIT